MISTLLACERRCITGRRFSRMKRSDRKYVCVSRLQLFQTSNFRGGEWYLEKRGSRKILTGSRNLGSVFDKSRSLVFAWFVFTFFESRNFLPESRARISN